MRRSLKGCEFYNVWFICAWVLQLKRFRRYSLCTQCTGLSSMALSFSSFHCFLNEVSLLGQSSFTFQSLSEPHPFLSCPSSCQAFQLTVSSLFSAIYSFSNSPVLTISKLTHNCSTPILLWNQWQKDYAPLLSALLISLTWLDICRYFLALRTGQTISVE